MILPTFNKFLITLGISFFLHSATFAQNADSPSGITPGTLTFTVKSITNNSTYSPKNVIAIWIKDAQGNFVVSRKVMANSRKNHLVKWNASSAGNSVSAITGSTLTSHQTHTITWDGKNAAGIEMQDGLYQIWVEYSSTNSASNGNQGPFLTVEFEKGPAIQHITPANATYYQNIVADWFPLGVGINDLSKSGASVKIFPNPFNVETTIQLCSDKTSQAYISVYDASGKKVTELINDSFSSGIKNFYWDGTSTEGQKLSNGIYFIHIQVNGFTEIQKVMINR
jgi:flagellar hook assembly protein FlgD